MYFKFLPTALEITHEYVSGALVLLDATGATIAYYVSNNLELTWAAKTTTTTYETSATGLTGSGDGLFTTTWTSGQAWRSSLGNATTAGLKS